MAVEKGKHPLDDEGLAVVVSLTHGTTLTQAVGVSESREGESVSDAIEAASQQALDALLAQLEVIGG